MNNERRRYFRINDTVGVAYRLINSDELTVQNAGKDNATSVFGLLANYENTLQELLKNLRSKDPQLEDVLSTLNKKINCVINQLELDTNLVERLAHQIQDVNISACGMAFMVEEAVQVGQHLSLDIVLQPDNQHVFTYATVIHSETAEDGQNTYIRVNFHGTNSDDQEILIQHIVKRQSSLIRNIREASGE